MSTVEPSPEPGPSARVVHGETPIAHQVRVMDTFLSQTIGAVGRGIAIDEALVFPFGEAEQVAMTNLLVPEPIDVLFTVDGQVTAVETMPAWRGAASGLADTVIELPEGGAFNIRPDDRVTVEGVA